MEDMMQGLGDMMKKQQRLMDETQRMGQGQEPGDRQQGEGQQPGSSQGEGEGQQPVKARAVSPTPAAVENQLKGLRGQGWANQALEDAERAMGEAEDAA